MALVRQTGPDVTYVDEYPSLGRLLKVENTPQLVAKMSEVLSILSKGDALVIFLSAKEGLSSELDTPQKLGLTKKQYYTRLKQLVEFGLLGKNENKYYHTAFGSIMYGKHLMGLLDSMKISKELEMIDLLKKSSKFKSEEIERFVSKLNPEAGRFDEVGKGHFETITTFDSMVRRVIELIEFAEKEIILVTRFQNELIINALLKKAERGVEIKIISDINMVEGYLRSEKEKIRMHDKNDKERYAVVSNPFYPAKIERRYSRVPYCILIVDQKQVGMEIVNNYEPNKFKMAVFGSDSSLSSQMKSEFAELWKVATVNPPQIKRA